MGPEMNYNSLRPIDFEYKSITVLPCIIDDDNEIQKVSNADADFYGIYLTKLNGTQSWIIDFNTSIQALRFVKFLLSIAKNYKPDEQ